MIYLICALLLIFGLWAFARVSADTDTRVSPGPPPAPPQCPQGRQALRDGGFNVDGA